MNSVFWPLLRKCVLVFFDDILIYSPTWQAHLAHFKAVLTLLTHLKVDLGHVISAQGVELDPSKVQAVLDWPIPQNVKAVRGFLGLTGYYRRFIQNYGKIAQPLMTLTKKEEGFSWGEWASTGFWATQKVLGLLSSLDTRIFLSPSLNVMLLDKG